MLGILRKMILFLLGGSAYVGLELLWRGRSHGTMFLAGGLCFLLLGRLHRVKPWLLRGVLGAGMITAVELLIGLLFNRDYRVWDYRRLPLHFLGQICLPFFILWVPVSLFAMALYDRAEKLLKKLRR